MKRHWHSVVFCGLIFLCLAGCDSVGGTNGSIKLDATDAKSALQSLHKMTTGMADEDRKAFVSSASGVAIRMNQGTQNNLSADTFWKALHGMTKSEIEAKAREIEAQQGPVPPKK